MKTRKNILGISLSISIISFVSLIFLSNESKIFQIALAFMGSAFVTFLLEIPNFVNLKKENFDRIYWSLFWLKSDLTILNNTIVNVLESNNCIPQYFYVQNLNQINNALCNLRNFDSNYYMSKNKNSKSAIVIKDLINKMNILSRKSNNYSISYSKNKIEMIKENKIESNADLNAEIMRKELTNISNFCLSYIGTIDKYAKQLFTNDQFQQWELDTEVINNMTETSRES